MTDKTKLYPPTPPDHPAHAGPPGAPGARPTPNEVAGGEAAGSIPDPLAVFEGRQPFRVPADSHVVKVMDHQPTQDFLAVQPTAISDEDASGGEVEMLGSQDLLDLVDEEELTTGVFELNEIDEIEKEQTGGEESHVIGRRYRITEGIAMGGMGAVFKVRHIRLAKDFALKIILSERSSDQRMQQFFFREARVLSALTHPNIVQITDFGRDDRFGSFLVMEHLHGESLFDRLERDGAMEVGVCLQIGLQIAEALDYMHVRDVIHCDIKPENVFLCRDQLSGGPGIGVKLIDFGLSRTIVRDAKLSTDEVGGTPAYAAPEQLAGLAPQPSMDIYGVGVLLYSMVTGWPPFSGTVEEILGAKRTQDLLPPSHRLKKRLNPDVESLIMWAAARDPAKRPISMAQLIAELRTVILRLGYEVPESALDRARPVTGKHKLPGREENKRFFAGCPWPVFLTDRYCRFVAASPAFCAVVETPLDQLLGASLASSRLGQIHPDIEVDFAQARQRRIALLRRIDFSTPDGAQSSVYLWIAPQVTADRHIERTWAILMPLNQ